MPHDFIFATGNKNKALEIQSLLPDGFRVQTMGEAGLEQEIPEPYDTLEENSRTKARTIFAITGKDCFAEDTGLEVAALNGAPGVKSARYDGEPPNDARNMARLLTNLEAANNRAARFRTVLTLIRNGEEFQFEGICEGQIVQQPAGTNGFGYDPVFQPTGSTRTFGEMSLEEKNRFSHRKKAVAALVHFLKNTPDATKSSN
ncbi:MAG TPA: RdgB/HAM1 family non-canonical purine NTP pyrophosphatase [Lacibacter sp.]|nr:RdgB/HAM1 family non-canonical purine NTP pyrophosphatase [Lacibacter sp.]HMO89362.1 RdgB/HAM1 family non-canonical purine NTP pyrophosphatase [Lacibacter sp.]HMP87193.1 RdgB/HAM1 family non-canonical purine NTP pyrophosphatase [Lacibacter sp.]